MAQLRANVMIIEDEPLIALDLQRLVEQTGHQVSIVARTHDEAVTAALMQPPDLILADINLADGSSGLAAVNEIRETFDTRVIFITAYPDSVDRQSPSTSTFVISKPFSADAVKATISEALVTEGPALRG